VPLADVRGKSPGAVESDVEPGQDVVEVRQIWEGPETSWEKYNEVKDRVRERYYRQRRLEKHDVGKVNAKLENARLAVRQAEIDHKLTDQGVFLLTAAEDMVTADREVLTLEKSRSDAQAMVETVRRRFGADSPLADFADEFAGVLSSEVDNLLQPPKQRLEEMKHVVGKAPPRAQAAVEHFVETSRKAEEDTASIKLEIDSLKNENARHRWRMATAQGERPEISVGDIVRAYPANRLGFGQKLAIYFSRWREYLLDDPREANSEGGVFPAIWGTVTMTLIMSFAVVPFGVLAGLYLREYAKAGVVVSAVRIAINNLAGVPSIVFGVFGLGFFCYIIGAFWDGGPNNIDLTPMPGLTWWIVLTGLAVLGTVAFFTGLYSFSARTSEKSKLQIALGYASVALWLISAVVLIVLVFWTPYFSGFFEAKLPNPTFGKGGLMWASLTLALLTLPVVIVATEEALSAVPNSLREGSYACGGSKWQTIKRIVLPHAMPGIMTGMILAMARGAGEVAPLMLGGSRQAGTGIDAGPVAAFLPRRPQLHALGLSHFRPGFPEPEQRSRQAHGVYHHLVVDRHCCLPERGRRAAEKPAQEAIPRG
jgi:ABC-type phosphate transport system permease subunit/ABC-type phosphate transport system auxiliary subunit